MLHTRTTSRFARNDAEFDGRVKLIRWTMTIAFWLFAGAVMGGIVGLFVYANSRQPEAHDGVFAIIQIVGVLIGLLMGYLAARSAEAQEQLIEASQRAGLSMLKKYKPKPGTSPQTNVGERVIGSVSNAGEDFLKSLLGGGPPKQNAM